jgi:transcriptional regulator with XRE-family HTH domain
LSTVNKGQHELARRLGRNIRDRRLAMHLGLESASERAEGVHWRHWQKIEAGEVNITLRTLTRIATALEADASDLSTEPPSGAEVGERKDGEKPR